MTTYRIWKYDCETPYTVMGMPRGALIISAGYIKGRIVVWAEVDPSQPRVTRHIRCYNTGSELSAGEFIGTVITDNGIVWHVYEVFL